MAQDIEHKRLQVGDQCAEKKDTRHEENVPIEVTTTRDQKWCMADVLRSCREKG